MPTRPESDFYQERLGKTILAFAEEYRKEHPEATLSEVLNHIDRMNSDNGASSEITLEQH